MADQRLIIEGPSGGTLEGALHTYALAAVGGAGALSFTNTIANIWTHTRTSTEFGDYFLLDTNQVTWHFALQGVTKDYWGQLASVQSVYGGPSGTGFKLDMTANFTSEDSTAMHFTAELLAPDGSTIQLATIDPTATCAISVTMDADTTGGERFPQFDLATGDCGVVNSDSMFEVQVDDPGLETSRCYKAEFTVVAQGKTYVGSLKFYT